MQIRIGCDPELFLQDPITGAFVSGHGVLPGNKEAPFKVNKGAVQIDGTALEFNTDPADSLEEFLGNISAVMEQMQEIAGADRKIVAVPVAEYTEEYFKTIPEEALMLGCNPDYNAWTLDMNEAPEGDRFFRTGSGHIHIGWGTNFRVDDADHFLMCAQLCKQLDYYIGVASLIWDPDDRRRSMYGKAGAMRIKPYGMEYRVPSNAWLNSEVTRKFVYEAAVKATQDLMAGNDKAAQFGDLARTIIDNNILDWREKYDFDTGLDYSVLKAA